MPHMLVSLGKDVFSLVYAIHPKPSVIRKAIELAFPIAPGLAVSYQDTASGAWYRCTKLTEEDKNQ
jgi:hypothetical protein